MDHSGVECDGPAAPAGSDHFCRTSLDVNNLAGVVDRLETYEKVSLVFLMFEPSVALEESKKIAEGAAVSNTSLSTWTRTAGKHWRETLVEALMIIKAYSDVRLLNLDPELMKKYFLSDVVEISTYIHPVKKALFSICEELTKDPTEKLIDNVLKKSSIAIEKISQYHQYLEIFFLKLIQEKVIVLGSWSPKGSSSFEPARRCNIDFLAEILKTEHYLFSNWLTSSSKFINNQMDSASISNVALPGIEQPSDFTQVYPIVDYNNMGYFLIFNHHHFSGSEEHLNERSGTDRDAETLQACWTKFGFEVIVFRDLKHNEIIPKICSYAKNVKKNHSAFAVCILSHGLRGKIYGSDGKFVAVKELKEALHSQELLEKPKILIVQACRGSNVMGTSIVDPPDDTDSHIETDGLPVNVKKIPDMADLLTFWSTVENYVSFRDINKGSWFIQELCQQMMEQGERNHLMDVFIQVNNSLSKKMYQISQLESTFRKKLFLKKLTTRD